MSGPTVDGTGKKSISETTPQDSVNKSVRTDVPGGESKKGSQIEMIGPNAAKK